MIAKRINYIAAALLCLATVSCKEDTTIMYYNATMGNIVEGTFISDQGNIFNIAEQDESCNKNLLEMKRAYILCDVLCKTEQGLENEYDIRLNAVADVLTKEIITLGTEAEEEKLVEDPISIEHAWFSGGYINLYIVFAMKQNSKTPHLINLVQQETDKGYLFRLTHNAYGEKLGDDTVWGAGYVSFPISSIITEESADIKLEWTFYKISGSIISQETERKSAETTYKKGGFEHAPKTAVKTTKAAVR